MNMHDALKETAHRPWPLPAGEWIMEQTWRDLLFAHWSFPIEAVRAAVPAQLPLDTFDGRAWVGVVPFQLEGLRVRGPSPTSRSTTSAASISSAWMLRTSLPSWARARSST
jgi:uncharacterized protein YqjF (DUF2071 family)